MVYFFGLLGVYYGFLVGWVARYRGKALLSAALTPLACTAVLRGSVGTDTLNYEAMVAAFRSTAALPALEPGFALLLGLAALVFKSDVLAIRFVSLVFVLLLLVFAARADRDELLTLFGYIVPAFFFQYSMNGLRIGLASALFLLAIQCSRRGQRNGFGVLSLSAISFHYSIAVSILVTLAIEKRWLSRGGIGLLAIAAVVSSAFVYLNQGYFVDKLALYAAFEPPGAWSGASKIAPVAVLLVGVLLSSLPIAERLKLLAVGGGLCASFMAVASFSYAGLRFLDLLAFLVPLMILVKFAQHRMALDGAMRAALLAAGVLAGAGMLLGFASSRGVGEAPFLPYDVWF